MSKTLKTVIIIDQELSTVVAKTEDILVDVDIQPHELMIELAMNHDLKAVIEKHNEERVTHIDKQAKKRHGKDVFLEPVTYKDLDVQVK